MRAPHVTDLAGVDAAAIGIPFDTATTFRSGARFGPEAIRSASALIRPYHPALGVNVVERLSIVDYGDLPVAPGDTEGTYARVQAALAPVVEAGVFPLVMGGDHSITLAELRVLAGAHGPLALVQLDAHADTWDAYYGERYFHGTPFRRALEEGLIAPERSLLAGMRGPLYAASDLDEPRAWGFEIVPCDELRRWTPEHYGRRVRERLGAGPAFLSFDIDVLDPAFAPGTGTPEVGGLLPHEALALLRALAGVEFTGYDVVEVSPQFDGPGQVTAVNAAAIGYELLALSAVAKGKERA